MSEVILTDARPARELKPREVKEHLYFRALEEIEAMYPDVRRALQRKWAKLIAKKWHEQVEKGGGKLVRPPTLVLPSIEETVKIASAMHRLKGGLVR